MICVVLFWRCAKTKSIFVSERYARTENPASIKRRFRATLQGKGRLLCAKLHTGTRYDNCGRFV